MTNNDNLRLLEIKCPVEGVTKTAVELAGHLDYVTIDDEFKYGLKSNHKYYGQIQLGLFLLGFETCDFVIYSSYDSSFFKVTVTKDNNFLTKMIPCITEVYFKCLLPKLI